MKKPGDCTKSRFAENLRTGKLDGEVCVLRCVYLFVICLFVVCLCVCFLFTFTEPFVGFGGLVLFEREGRSVCSPAGLMEDVMKSLNSFLTCCYYCSYLFVLLLSIVSVYKPVC